MMRVCFMALLCASALPLMGQSNDAGAWFETGTIRRTTDPQGLIRFDHSRGWGISANHFWTNSFSTEVAYARTKSNGRVDFPEGSTIDLGQLTLKSTTLVAQWHFAKRSLIDPYVGAGAARVKTNALTSSDLQAGGVSAVHIDSRYTWCAAAGVNVNVTRQIAVAVDGKYVRYNPNSAAAGDEQPIRLKLNPLFVAAGVRLRF